MYDPSLLTTAKVLANIPNFSGISDIANFDFWLSKIETTLGSYGIFDDMTRVRAFAIKLQKTAIDYLNRYQKNNPIEGQNLSAILANVFYKERQVYGRI